MDAFQDTVFIMFEELISFATGLLVKGRLKVNLMKSFQSLGASMKDAKHFTQRLAQTSNAPVL
jgi:hypothetical protein